MSLISRWRWSSNSYIVGVFMGLLYQFPYINRAYILPMTVAIVNWYKYYSKDYSVSIALDGSASW